MADSLYVAASGALARLIELETVANNLANTDTSGYKRDRTVFDAALESALTGESGDPLPGAAGRVFVDIRTSGTDHRSGPVQSTGNPLDVAVDGPGFFIVETPDGPRYTRSGAFLVSDTGVLSTSGGFPVLTEAGAITVGNTQIEINNAGEIADQTGNVLGRLSVVTFDPPSSLVKVGANLFSAPEGVGPAERPDPAFVARSLEGSNVQPVRELAAMVTLQRLFDVTLQSLRADDQATQRLIQEVSG